MTRVAALGTIFASVVLIGLAYASAFLPGGAPPAAGWAMTVGIAAQMVAAMALGASRDGRVGWLWIPFALIFLLLLGAFGSALLLPPARPDAALWLGLPPRAAVILYGLGLVPILLVPLAYALSFERVTLRDGDVERVREARALREAAARPEDAA